MESTFCENQEILSCNSEPAENTDIILNKSVNEHTKETTQNVKVVVMKINDHENIALNEKRLQHIQIMEECNKSPSTSEREEIGFKGNKSICYVPNSENKVLNIKEKITVVELDEAKRRITSRLMKGIPRIMKIRNSNEKVGVKVGSGQVIRINTEDQVILNDVNKPALKYYYEEKAPVIHDEVERNEKVQTILTEKCFETDKRNLNSNKTGVLNLVCVKKLQTENCHSENSSFHENILNDEVKELGQLSLKNDSTRKNIQFAQNNITYIQLDNQSELKSTAKILSEETPISTKQSEYIKLQETPNKVTMQILENDQYDSVIIKQEQLDGAPTQISSDDVLTADKREHEQADNPVTMQVEEDEPDVIMEEDEQAAHNIIMQVQEQEEVNYNVAMQMGEHEQVIVMGEDGQVLIVQKDGNEEHMIVGDYVHDGSEALLQMENIKNSQKLISNNSEVYEDNANTNQDCEGINSEDTSDEGERKSLQTDGVTIVHVNNHSKKRILTKVVKGHLNDNSSGDESGQVIDKLTCKYCKKRFTKSSNKLRHLRTIHNVKKNVGSHIRCIECDSMCFKHVQKLRDHLQVHHNLDMSEQELHFPNMNAFKKWKCEIERKNLCSYTLRHGFRKTAMGPKHFYVCHRSGRYLPKIMGERQRMLRVGGTCKLGIVCTAAIYCQELPNEVIVRYIPHHYGHGKETSFVQLSPEEQTAIQESVSNGVPFETLLDDIRDSQSKDTFQLFLLKKRDFRWINSAFRADEYNPGMSDAESVENWVRRSCQMEDSPVLFYQQQNIGSDQEEFMLVIMTEFQKHILLSSKKDVICVDSLYRRKGGRFYLTVLLVMDEFDNAFPVAFSISNRVDKDVILQFFSSVKESTGNLSVKYFISDSEAYFYESWVSVMNDEPRWLWSIWYVDSKIRTQLKIFKGNVAKRAEVYKTMRLLLECQNEDVFKCMFKNFIDSLHSNQLTKEFGNFILNKYGSNTEMWATCYRKEVDLSTNIHLEVMHRTFRYCCREGRKKRLDKFLFVVLKFIKCKMLDRFANMLDEEKLNLAIEAINMCHIAGLEIPSENMSALSEKIWLINSDNEDDIVYITKELDKCPEHCNLRCEECDICVHQYSCSCVHSMINANLCMHIHAVVWKFLTPHFSPAVSPSHSAEPLNDDVNAEIDYSNCTDVFEDVLKRTHDVYKKIKANRCNLNKNSLALIMKKLDECVDICSGKKVEELIHQPATAIPNNPVYLLNPYVKTPSQPFILPNSLPSAKSNDNGTPQYIVLLPNNSNIPK